MIDAPSLRPRAVRGAVSRRARRRGTLALALSILGATAAATPAWALTGTSKITGVVIAAKTSEPIESIEVCAQSTRISSSGCAKTESNGEYTIAKLAPGPYLVEFSRGEPPYEGNPLNFVTQYWSDAPTAEAAKRVEIASEGDIVKEINAKMAEGSEIEGEVIAAVTGKPLSRVEVCAEAEIEPEAEASRQCSRTDEKTPGRYRLAGLANLDYQLAFNAPEECNVFCQPLNYITQFYNGATEPSQATGITFTAPGEHRDIDAALEQGAQVTGKVTVARSGAPAANIEVCAETLREYYPACTGTNAKGEYKLQGLATGSYAIGIYPEEICTPEGCLRTGYIPEYYNNEFKLKAANLVSVTAPFTVTGINAELVERPTQLAEEAKKAEEAATLKKHEEEAAAVKKRAEELLLAKKHAEQVALLLHQAEVRDTSVRIEKIKVTATSLYITVKLSRTGVLTITGSGLKRTVVHLYAGTHRVRVRLTRTGRRDRAHRKKIKVKMSFSAGTVTLQELKTVRL